MVRVSLLGGVGLLGGVMQAGSRNKGAVPIVGVWAMWRGLVSRLATVEGGVCRVSELEIRRITPSDY